MPPRVVILAGPNGAGKTTLARQVLPEVGTSIPFVNADEIERGLDPAEMGNPALAAGRMMLERLDAHAAAGEDFAFETTLASRTFAPWLRRLLADGYRVDRVYCWLPDVALNIARVATRVAHGGHHVPEDVIRRRYERGRVNFRTLYRDLATSWEVFDTSEPHDPALIAAGRRNAVSVAAQPELWRRFLAEEA